MTFGESAESFFHGLFAEFTFCFPSTFVLSKRRIYATVRRIQGDAEPERGLTYWKFDFSPLEKGQHKSHPGLSPIT
jgi:hypothetical protein